MADSVELAKTECKMNLLLFKYIAITGIFLTGIIGGLSARKVAESAQSELLFSVGNSFAGGVFLGAGLIHMLPDAQSAFSIIGNNRYPWSVLICCLGFLLILFLEKVLLNREHAVEKQHPSSGESMTLYPYILMLVLSVHSLITGIALGTEKVVTQALIILLAVVAHKGTAAFALGVSLLRNRIPMKHAVLMLVSFSLMTSIGIALGMGLIKFLSANTALLFEGLFDALAAGTFLYIALLDILNDEFSQNQRLYLKFCMVALGFSVMAIVAIWT